MYLFIGAEQLHALDQYDDQTKAQARILRGSKGEHMHTILVFLDLTSVRPYRLHISLISLHSSLDCNK